MENFAWAFFPWKENLSIIQKKKIWETKSFKSLKLAESFSQKDRNRSFFGHKPLQ